MNTRASLRRGLAVLVAVLLLATAVSVALGAEISLLGGKLRTGDTVSVPTGETFDGNLYLFAGTATVDGTVDGDLTAFAGQVTVNGDVSGDLLVAGGTVTVNGDVTGDVRTAGGQVSLNGAIGEDLLVSGGQVTLAGGGAVAGDAIASGGTLSIAGTIEGSIEGSAGTYSRTGDIGGSERVRVSTDADAERDDDAPAVAGGDRLADGLRHFVILLILGGLLLWIMPRVIRGPTETLRTRPLLSLGGGFLAWIGFVVLVIATVLVAILLAIMFGLVQLGALAAIEIVAAILALMSASFLFWLAVAFLADLVVGFTLARLVAPEAPGASPWRDLGLLAGGVAVVVIVTSLPVIGGIAKLLVVLFGLGALAVAAWNRWRGPARPTMEEPASV